jgi:hypothetical protein
MDTSKDRNRNSRRQASGALGTGTTGSGRVALLNGLAQYALSLGTTVVVIDQRDELGRPPAPGGDR